MTNYDRVPGLYWPTKRNLNTAENAIMEHAAYADPTHELAHTLLEFGARSYMRGRDYALEPSRN